MRRSSSESDGFPVLAALAIFSFSFVCCFLARLHWVREEAVAGQGVVVEEHVLESGVVAEVEVVLAGTDGEGGGDQQDGGRAPTEVGLPALHSISLFTFHCCQACCQKTD